MKTTALLALEDGTIFPGSSCGAEGECSGEAVFNTSLTGYQEVLTDPSYKGQLVVMTNPLIGNTGITAGDNESRTPFLEAFVVRELCRYPSNWESVESVGSYLKTHGIVGIEGIDTRMLTRRLRDKGALRAILSTKDLDPKSLRRRVRDVPSMVGRDLTALVTCDAPYGWEEPLRDPEGVSPIDFPRQPHIVLMDFGAKYSIMRCLCLSAVKSPSSPLAPPPPRSRRCAPTASCCPTAPAIPSR